MAALAAALVLAALDGPWSAAAEEPRDPELARARQLIDALDAGPDDYALAEDLVKQVLDERPDDPSAVTAYAQVDTEFIVRGFDVSEKRRAAAQRYAARAVQLAPHDAAALGALGVYLSTVGGAQVRARDCLRRAIALAPAEPRYYRALAGVMFVTEPDAAVAFAEKAAARFPRDALVHYDLARLYRDAGRFEAMERALDATLDLAPVTSAIVGRARLALWLRGDVAGMRRWLDRVPLRQQDNDRCVLSRYFLASVSGQPREALAPLRGLLQDWLQDFDYTGPKALLVGDLLAAEGDAAGARTQYEVAREMLARERRVAPTARVAELWTLRALGRTDDARAVLHSVVASLRRPYRVSINWWFSPIPACLLLGEPATARQLLVEAAAAGPEARLLLRSALRIDPRLAAWRADADFTALLAEPGAP